ncbi:MAG: nicotinate-nucleotide adenylyltransferase [Prevotella sp.]|nr:nicotinate-nucleotide adenylyltransferase [Prevotella sp.]
MRIGLFGGSFNPIHNGHVMLGELMLEHAGLDEVWYVVSPLNPLKNDGRNQEAEETRLHLVELALKDKPRLKASDYEFKLPRPSYTWNTLQNLKQDYPEDEFVLIIGGDNWEHFDRWAHYEDILREYEIAVYPRGGAEIKQPPGYAKGVNVYDLPLFPISSTEVREMVHKRASLAYIVPDAVAEEIEKYSFYR